MHKIVMPLNHDGEPEPIEQPTASSVSKYSLDLQQELENLSTQAAVKIVNNDPGLYKNINPEIDSEGIVRGMTLNPESIHKIDLQSQISNAIGMKEEKPTALVADLTSKPINAGGSDFAIGQQLMGGGSFVAPQNPNNSTATEKPKPTINDIKPGIIIG